MSNVFVEEVMFLGVDEEKNYIKQKGRLQFLKDLTTSEKTVLFHFIWPTLLNFEGNCGRMHVNISLFRTSFP